MIADQMLDYVFDQLDATNRAAFERQMTLDPELMHKVGRLRESVRLMVDDGEEIEVPSSLASRTLAAVEYRKTHRQPSDYLPSRVPFRLADFAVAATVFFAATLTLSVPLLRSRAQMDQAACSFNLGKLGVSLANYASTHGTYPQVPESRPAGAYGLMLQDAHALSDPEILRCPTISRQRPTSVLPPYETLTQLSPEHYRELFEGHFAYNVGFGLHGQSDSVRALLQARMPVASDGPGLAKDGRILEGNSPNHGGRGQNVLYCDGHCEFRRGRWISNRDRDLFLNEANMPAAGLHSEDSALVPSIMPVRFR